MPFSGFPRSRWVSGRDVTGHVEQSHSTLSHRKLREPQKLIMFVGAKFEATVNGKGFNQSQLLVMCEIPNRDTIRGKFQIKLFAAPLGVLHFDTTNGHIDQGNMIANGWKPV